MPPTPPSSSPSATTHPALQAPPSTTVSPRRVLVVDDDVELCEVIAMLLADEGYEVSSAGNGQQALTRVLIQTPDVVLLDLVMPVMSGRELLDLRPWFAELESPAIIVMSAAVVDDSLDVAAVISKPFLLEELLMTVRRVAGPPVRQDGAAPSRKVPRRRA